MADNLQNAKQTVSSYIDDIESAKLTETVQVLARYCDDEYRFRGVHPLNEIADYEQSAMHVWVPLKRAITGLQRRQDILMAGTNEIDGQVWVISMGTFMGLFDSPWLGIPPHRKLVLLPYCEFFRLAASKIAESAMFLDILRLMMQTGLQPLPVAYGAEIPNPGPRTHDGVMIASQDASETATTLQLISQMMNEFVETYGGHYPERVLRRTWHDNMAWFGSAGFGATCTVDGFLRQHENPFRNGFSDIRFNGHVCRFAEGSYAGWFGWPNLTMRPSGGVLGLTESATPADMRVVDIYRREGDKLAENWVFIDTLHWLKQQGVDVLARSTSDAAQSSG